MGISPVLACHIGSAGVALLAGAAAMTLRKGTRRHRIAGRMACASMLVMSASASSLAFRAAEAMNLVVGVLTFYLVLSGWQAARREVLVAGAATCLASSPGLAAACGGLVFGLQAAGSATGLKDGTDAGSYFVFGAIAGLAVAGDVLLLLRGRLSGRPRTVRHVWRTCFAMLITAISFFLGKMRLFPGFIRKADIEFAPVVAVAALMAFWLLRVSFSRPIRLDVMATPDPARQAAIPRSAAPADA